MDRVRVTMKEGGEERRGGGGGDSREIQDALSSLSLSA